jgi:hypothetical protein
LGRLPFAVWALALGDLEEMLVIVEGLLKDMEVIVATREGKE